MQTNPPEAQAAALPESPPEALAPTYKKGLAVLAAIQLVCGALDAYTAGQMGSLSALLGHILTFMLGWAVVLAIVAGVIAAVAAPITQQPRSTLFPRCLFFVMAVVVPLVALLNLVNMFTVG